MISHHSSDDQKMKYFKMSDDLLTKMLDGASTETENMSNAAIKNIFVPLQKTLTFFTDSPYLKHNSNEPMLEVIINIINKFLLFIQEIINELDKKYVRDKNFVISNKLKQSILRFKKSMNRYVILLPKLKQEPVTQLISRITYLLQKVLESFGIFKYIMDETLYQLEKPASYNAKNLHIDDALHEFIFDMTPNLDSFDESPFLNLKNHVKEMRELYCDGYFSSSAIQCIVVIEGLLNINLKHMKKNVKPKTIANKLNMLSENRHFDIIFDDQFKEAFIKIKKYRDDSAHPNPYYNSDKNIATLSFYMLILINNSVRTNIQMSKIYPADH